MLWCVTTTNLHQSANMSELCHSFPVEYICTLCYVHVLYVGCGRGNCVGGEPMYKGYGRDWFGMGHCSKLTMDDCG